MNKGLLKPEDLSDREDFLKRWSRLKRESASSPPKPVPTDEKPPQLPALDALTFESDFKDFMHSKVEEGVKRAALKKLFSDPRFNIMDGLDTYIDDYSKADPIPEELLAKLQHARQTLFRPADEAGEAAQSSQENRQENLAEQTPAEENPGELPKQDGNPAQDA